jgi:MinD-like ATPase involved in chromosome partitioning or flagellar assembly
LANDDRDLVTGTEPSPGDPGPGSAYTADAGARPPAAPGQPPGPPDPDPGPDDEDAAFPVRSQQLYGEQPPFASRAFWGPAAPQQPLPSRVPGAAAEDARGPQGSWDSFSHTEAPGPAEAYGPAGAYDPADPYGPAEVYGSADPYGSAEEYGPADEYGPVEAYGPADPYGPADDFRTAEDLRPPEGRRQAEAHHPPEPPRPGPGYGPPGAPSAHGAPGSYGPPGAHRPPGPDRPARGPGGPSGPNPPAPHAGEGPAPAGGGSADRPTDLRVAAEPQVGRPPSAPAGQHAAPAAPAAPTAEPTESLTRDFLLPGRRRAPSPGWRRVIYQATGGLMRVPVSATELRRRDMINRVRTPVAGGHHRVAVLSLKGGVGKTTTTVGLGSTLASLRGDRVIAVDANPDRGTLSDKVGLETAATVRDLLNERGRIRRYADVRAFTSQAASRLEVLASDRDPTVSVAFGDDDYCHVAGVLEHYYSICLTDCGTGLLHSAMAGVLRLADQIVLVSSPSVDGARSASATLDWLAAHTYGDLVRNAVVVLSVVRPRNRSTIDLNRLEEHFAARCRAVTRIPYDSHLEEGAEVELEQLSRPTADAYLTLAAIVGDGFGRPRRPEVPAP